MTTTIELQQLKQTHRATWAAGDYVAVADAYVRPIGQAALAAAAPRPGAELLDVAAGAGNAAIPAALAGARVTALDLVPELLAAGRHRAATAGVAIEWVEGDAEALPFDDASFDVALSTLGVQFAPRHERSAAELARVTRPGGTIVVCSWTPASLIGGVFKAMGPFLPAPPAGASPPPLWGDEEHVRALFAGTGVELSFETRAVDFHHDSPSAFVDFMADAYGPMLKTRERLAGPRWEELRSQLIALCERRDAGGSGFRAPSEYLLAVGHKRG